MKPQPLDDDFAKLLHKFVLSIDNHVLSLTPPDPVRIKRDLHDFVARSVATFADYSDYDDETLQKLKNRAIVVIDAMHSFVFDPF